MTELEPLIKAFVKTLEEATNTSDLTSTQFECRRVVMDSLDIEPGTVICVDGWEAMRIVGNGDRNGLDSTVVRTLMSSSAHDVVRVVHYRII